MKFLLRHRDLIAQGCLFFSVLVLCCAAEGIGDLIYTVAMI